MTYGIPPILGQLLYSEATTKINEPYVFENGTSTITDFTTSGTLTPGFSFADVTSIPNPGGIPAEVPVIHEMLTDHQGRPDGGSGCCWSAAGASWSAGSESIAQVD